MYGTDNPDELLLKAVKEHSSVKLQDALKLGADPNALSKYNRTPLLVAAESGKLTLSLTKLLVNAGADVNARDKNGWNALMHAMMNDICTQSLVKFMVKSGFDINAQDKNGNTVLILGAELGRLLPKELDAFLRNDVDCNIQNNEGLNAPMCTMHWGYVTPELIEVFVNHGLNLDARDKNGKTFFMHLASYSSCFTKESVSTMTRCGADLGARDNKGMTVLMHAAANSTLRPDVLEVLVQFGSQINERDNLGQTALMHSFRNGGVDFELLQKFIGLGADTWIRDEQGDTVLTKIIKNHKPFMPTVSDIGVLAVLFSLSTEKEKHAEELAVAIESSDMPSDKRALVAFTLSAALYPVKNKALLQNGLNRVSETIKKLLSIQKMPVSSMQVIGIASEGSRGSLTLDTGQAKRLVGMLLECIETNPDIAIKFTKQRVAENLQQWLDESVPGTDELLAKITPLIGRKKEKQKKNTETENGIPFFEF